MQLHYIKIIDLLNNHPHLSVEEGVIFVDVLDDRGFNDKYFIEVMGELKYDSLNPSSSLSLKYAVKKNVPRDKYSQTFETLDDAITYVRELSA